MPSFFALGHPLIGNSSLRPERSQQFQIGVEEAAFDERLNVQITGFAARYQDLVDFDPVAFTNINRGLVHVRGVEASASFAISDAFLLKTSTTYASVAPSGAAPPLRRRPRWKGSASIEWAPRAHYGARVDSSWSGRFYDSSVPTGLQRLVGYWLVDASAYYKLDRDLRVSLSLSNLFNGDHEQSIGFPIPGRGAVIALQMKY